MTVADMGNARRMRGRRETTPLHPPAPPCTGRVFAAYLHHLVATLAEGRGQEP